MTEVIKDFKHWLQVSYIDNADRSTLEQTVATYINSHEAPRDHLKDILNYGCQSGTVNDMIYYADTHKFFDKHYDDIEELRNNWKEETGMELDFSDVTNLKNFLAWWGFECTCNDLCMEWEGYKALNHFDEGEAA